MAALVLRWLLRPLIGGHAPFFTVYAAVLLAARYYGVGPAVVTAAVAGAAALFTGGFDIVRIVLYPVFCGFAIWLVDALCRANERAGQSAREAAESLEKLRREVAQRTREEQVSAQLRAIVESSDDAIVSEDLDGVIRSWNRGAEQVFGYTAAEAVGQRVGILLPPERPREEDEILERIRRGGRVKHYETVRARRDGKRIHVSLSVSPVFDAAGNVVGASHIARDITERREFEEQLNQARKLESLGVLAGGMAHDFNNLLTGIMGNAGLAADDLPARHPVRQRIEDILAASDRAAVLVRQMLSFAGKGSVIIERLNISAVVEEVSPALRTLVPDAVDLKIKLEPGLPAVEGDRSQIQQLVLNLAINAAEAIDGEKGTIAITTSARSSESSPGVVLEVRDTGRGMDERVRSRIFDPFFTTKFTGRGLGLSAALGIIRTHRGSITVESAPGLGSTFTVVLPACKASSGGETDELRCGTCGAAD